MLSEQRDKEKGRRRRMPKLWTVSSIHPIDKGEKRAGMSPQQCQVAANLIAQGLPAEGADIYAECKVLFAILQRKPPPTYTSMQIFAEKSWLGHERLETRHFVKKFPGTPKALRSSEQRLQPRRARKGTVDNYIFIFIFQIAPRLKLIWIHCLVENSCLWRNYDWASAEWGINWRLFIFPHNCLSLLCEKAFFTLFFFLKLTVWMIWRSLACCSCWNSLFYVT